jgi:hypothetical protein
MYGVIWDRGGMTQLGWVRDGKVTDKDGRHVATEQDGELFSLLGERLNARLTDCWGQID